MNLIGLVIAFSGVFVVLAALAYRISTLTHDVQELTEHADRCDKRHEALVEETAASFKEITQAWNSTFGGDR